MKKETLRERIDYLMKFNKGTMPVGMIVDTEREAREARRILNGIKKRAARLIKVKVDPI